MMTGPRRVTDTPRKRSWNSWPCPSGGYGRGLACGVDADVERVEVLRGPQGTLYGQGTSGGAIKIVTNQPDLEEYQAKFLGGVYNIDGGGTGYQINAALNLPMVKDVLGLRLVVYQRDEAGYIDRVAQPAVLAPILGPNNAANAIDLIEKNFNDEQTVGVRAQLRYEPSPDLVITPSVMYQRTKVGGRQTFQPMVGDLKEVRELANPEREEFVLAALRVEYDLDWAQLSSVSTLMKQKGTSVEDVSGFVRGILGDLQSPSDRKSVV